jgi:hypothetical protein
LTVFAGMSLVGLVAAALIQWVFNKPVGTPDSPAQQTVAYMTAHAGQDQGALLVAIRREGGQAKVDDVLSPAPKWIGSAWEQLVANELDAGDFDRAFEIVRAAPSSTDKGAALHNVLHVVRVSPRSQLPVFGWPLYAPAPVAPALRPAADDFSAFENSVAETALDAPVDFPTVGNYKRNTQDLPLVELPAEHRNWVALTIGRLKTAESIARDLDPLPVVYGAWIDIKNNYESLQQWESAEQARTAAIQVLVAYDSAQYWQAFRETWLWPAVKAILAAAALGLGSAIFDLYRKTLQFYSARGFAALFKDKEFRKHLGVVVKNVQSGLILPERDGHANGSEATRTGRPR